MLQLRVYAIKWETADTATFFLSEVDGKHIAYKAGQFITLVFTHHQTEIRRSYSISSSPGEALLAITVKRIPNGEISRFLLSKTKIGDVWNALEPSGKFVVADHQKAKNLFYFAAGSGIVPVYSQLKTIFSESGKSHVTLVYSSRNTQSTLFYAELNQMAIAYANRFTLVNLFSESEKGLRPRRLNNELVIQLVNNGLKYPANDAAFFLCGPFVYMRMIKLTLVTMHFKPSQIRKENFVIEAIPEVTFTTYPTREIKVDFAGKVYDLIVGENQSILDAAWQNGIHLPYSCKAGICSSCTAICSSGKVAMSVNDVLTDEDMQNGWILTCTGHPVSDDVIIGFP
ncbi:2Fe-2S iron-sulfur cluster binding domain-containing protein [Mucilaginibacter sp. HMF5004]|uniref:flavin reductase family protein n=1 Tax=Mucilaginibacter rivuli TaxID=2857527 RepID=UPI001C5DF3BA|nr:2Fe-2S iron-sulfur cluster-binding protein [Mucilaginibacter rivuli]MBW4888348.1 2Fe-2S iron-sulfur cluster binding domain-containing protein [Mucilaginibacter rivuli]